MASAWEYVSCSPSGGFSASHEVVIGSRTALRETTPQVLGGAFGKEVAAMGAFRIEVSIALGRILPART